MDNVIMENKTMTSVDIHTDGTQMCIEDKLKLRFPEMTVYKDLKNSGYLSSLGLPSFLRDYLLKTFCDEDGGIDKPRLEQFVKDHVPRKNDWPLIKNKVVVDGEEVKIVARIIVSVNIKEGNVTFALPDFNLTDKETLIEEHIWRDCESVLASGKEIWGIVTLGYRLPSDRPKVPGKILMTDFQDFCPYDIDLEYYKEQRESFSTREWIDVILGAMDYNPNGYKNDDEKLAVLKRILPFVENRLNLIELAPKGTGKSYMFGHVSKYGLLIDGGMITRSKMFYDVIKKQDGFVVGPDYVAIDEVKLVNFGNNNEMRSILQGYMEYGSFNVNGHNGSAQAGVVFLGNIEMKNMNINANMFTELPKLFQESALLDRIHGFVEGWQIPRMTDDLKVSGWALNSEYFCGILHLIRDDMSYRRVVDEVLDIPEKADTRDTEAIKRICTAYLKLIFPHITSSSKILHDDSICRIFQYYCLRPAKKMRQIIKIQLGILDEQFIGKDVPNIKVRKVEEDTTSKK